MLLQIITLYVTCDDLLRRVGYTHDPQTRMTTVQVMTTALAAAWFFPGNLEAASRFLHEPGYIPRMLDKSRLNAGDTASRRGTGSWPCERGRGHVRGE